MVEISDETKDEILEVLMSAKRKESFMSFLDNLIITVEKTDKLDLSEVPSEYSRILKNVDGTNVSAVLSFLDSLRDFLKHTDSIDVTLAFEPSGEFISKLYDKIYGFGYRNFVLNIVLNPEIKGGLVLEIRGKYVRLSLDDIIMEHFAENKDVFEKILHTKIQ